MRIKSVMFAILALAMFSGAGTVPAAMAAGSDYEVVYPSGRSTIQKQAPAPRLDTLEGKTICELWNYMFNGEYTFASIEKVMKERYPSVKFVSYEEFGTTHSVNEARDIAALPDKLRAAGCDAVISGNGC